MTREERVAAHMRERYLEFMGMPNQPDWPTLPAHRREKWLVMARAALEVME